MFPSFPGRRFALKHIFFSASAYIQLTSLLSLETKFVPLAFSKYLKANVLRSERVVDTDELWYGTGVPSLAGKYTYDKGCRNITFCGGHNLPPLIEIGLTNLSKYGEDQSSRSYTFWRP